jgi:hypothetical protein
LCQKHTCGNPGSGLCQKHTCGNPGSGLCQKHTCGSVKPVDGIQTLSIHVMFCYLIGKSYGV